MRSAKVVNEFSDHLTPSSIEAALLPLFSVSLQPNPHVCTDARRELFVSLLKSINYFLKRELFVANFKINIYDEPSHVCS